MVKTTNIYAGLLILLGVVGYFVTGMQSVTALIPSFFGIVVLIVALLARKPKLHKHMMHIAAVLAVLGVVATASAFGGLVEMLTGGDVARPAATVSRSLMAVLSLIYVILALNSFIQARRSPTPQS